MTSRNSLFIRRATLGLLLLAHLFLQMQVAIACVVENLPGIPCDPGVTPAAEHSQNQNDKTANADCCQVAYQPAAALYDAATPPNKNPLLLAGHAPVAALIAYVDLTTAALPARISITREAFPPGVLGTDVYLTTLRLRI